MTHDRAMEVAAVAVASFATTTAGAIAVDAGTVVTILAGVGVSGLSGYYAAQISITSQMSELRAEVRALRDELHRYYEIKERSRQAPWQS